MTSDREGAIRRLVAEIDAYLGSFAGPGIEDVRAGIARWKNGRMREVTPSRIRQMAYVDHPLAWMDAQGDRKLGGKSRGRNMPSIPGPSLSSASSVGPGTSTSSPPMIEAPDWAVLEADKPFA
jgi:hypothetical protein